jgi:hypothetical protein
MMKNVAEAEMKKEDFSSTGWLQLGDVVLNGFRVAQNSTI